MGFKEKVFRLSTYKERGTNFAQTVARMPRESGVNVLRKMREYGTNIVQTVARRWRENGENASRISCKPWRECRAKMA
jgi:cyanophycinase-like exopeptidase